MIRVNRSTHSGSLHESQAHKFVSPIERNVQLEETGVSLWITLLRHVCVQSELMLVLQLTHIDGQSVAAPNELQVETTLFMAPSSEHAPETLHNFVTCITARVRCNRLQSVNINLLSTTSSYLDGICAEVANLVELAFQDLVDAASNSFNLLRCLRRSGFEDKSDELLDICLGHALILTIWAQLELFTIAQHSRKCLIDT